jgi:hypothetical protein
MTTSYTSVFGGANIYPSDVSFASIDLTNDTVLVWPLDANTSFPVAASIIDVDASSAGFKIYMPAANLASTGQTTLFNNVGSYTFTVVDFSGNTLCAPASGEVWQIYITDNTTDAGSWQIFQYGVGVSSANAASLAGAGLKAVTTTLNQSMPVVSFNTSYTTSENDRASLLLWTGGVGILTLLNPATEGDWFVNVRNQGSGVLTITPPGSALIDGGLSKDLAPTESCIVVCDGTAFYTIGFGQNVNFAFDYTSIALPSTGVATYTLSVSEQNRIAYNFTGALTADIAVIVPPTVQQYWVDNQTTGSFSLTVRTASGTGYAVPQNSRAILYCDGTNVVNAATAGISTPISIANGGTGATTASGARINLGGGSTGIAVFQSTTQAQGQAALGASLVGAALFTSPASIASISTLVGGSGYVNGNYAAVPLINGSGTGATANITVTGGAVTTCTIVGIGVGYLPGDVLSAYNTYLGGTGAGFSVTVSTVTAAIARATLDVYSTSETRTVADSAAIAYAIGLG